jgi:hypothetical protein
VDYPTCRQPALRLCSSEHGERFANSGRQLIDGDPAFRGKVSRLPPCSMNIYAPSAFI